MSFRSRSVLSLAVVVCASLAALELKGIADWVGDLLMSGCAALAGRLKSGGSRTKASGGGPETAAEAEAEIEVEGPPHHGHRRHRPTRRRRWVVRRPRAVHPRTHHEGHPHGD
jgi:hypothetical protein